MAEDHRTPVTTSVNGFVAPGVPEPPGKEALSIRGLVEVYAQYWRLSEALADGDDDGADACTEIRSEYAREAMARDPVTVEDYRALAVLMAHEIHDYDDRCPTHDAWLTRFHPGDDCERLDEVLGSPADGRAAAGPDLKATLAPHSPTDAKAQLDLLYDLLGKVSQTLFTARALREDDNLAHDTAVEDLLQLSYERTGEAFGMVDGMIEKIDRHTPTQDELDKMWLSQELVDFLKAGADSSDAIEGWGKITPAEATIILRAVEIAKLCLVPVTMAEAMALWHDQDGSQSAAAADGAQAPRPNGGV